MRIGDRLIIKAQTGASQRTRNRIHERGRDGFTFKKGPQTTSFANNRGTLLILLESNSSDWSGWLPIDEIEVVS